MTRRFIYITFTLIFCLQPLKTSADQYRSKNSAEIQLALKQLNVLGSVLFIAAHPDDENTSLIAYLSKERLVRTAYLSVTRGDGGQNLLGSEKGELIGLLRTQELLAARGVDDTEQFFTRAVDFGYSKSAQESLNFWGRDLVLADIVWVIRKFKPDLLISRFSRDGGGHGHHSASAILTEEAFLAAGDKNKFPEQLQYVEPWQPKRLLWNTWRPQRENRNPDLPPLLQVDTGTYNPLLGESYTEIAARSRSMHKSQGFGSRGRRGTSLNYFEHAQGQSATNGLFDDIDLSWSRISKNGKITELIKKAQQNFNPENPSVIIPTLLNILKQMNSLPESQWVEIKKKELFQIIKACAGLWIDALASDHSASPGDNFDLNISVINRSDIFLKLNKIHFTFVQQDKLINEELKNNQPFTLKSTFTLPKTTALTQPYWLKKAATKGHYFVDDQKLIGLPENRSKYNVNFTIDLGGETVIYSVPVIYRWTDPVEGEKWRPFEITPHVMVNFEENVFIFADNKPQEISLNLRNSVAEHSGTLKLQLPKGWRGEPEKFNFSMKNKGEEKTFKFLVYPSEDQEVTSLKALVEIEGETSSLGIINIDYRHIPVQTHFPQAQAKLVRLDIQTKGSNIGYLMGSGDEIPGSLRQIGYKVTLLNEKSLAQTDLSIFDAVICGVRAYNTQPYLNRLQKNLLDYVYSGGTLIVQYNVSRRLVTDNIGPFPFTISRDRVTVEEATVKFLDPDHQFFNFPNKITQKDFQGWVQERGLYFANQWDPKFTALLSCNDPGEPERKGGHLIARFGKGVFVYTAYSWFRQLPAGVPGAYRLFANMIAAGKK